MAGRMLARLEKANWRDEVQESVGQVFVWNRDLFKSSLLEHTSKENVDVLVNLFRSKLQSQDKKMMATKHKARLKAAKASVIAEHMDGYAPSSHEIYAVFNYNSIQNIKRLVGKEFEKLSGKDSKIVTGRIDSGEKVSETVGSHVGHGEYGRAVSATKALASESVMKTKTASTKYGSTQAYKNLESHLETFKRSVGVSLEVDHYQEVTARGKLSKAYTAILSNQDTSENMSDAVDERQALLELKKAIQKEYNTLVQQEGSPSLLDAVEATLLFNLSSSKRVKYKGPKKPKANVSSKGKGSKSGTISSQKSTRVSSGAGATKPKRRATRKGVSSSPLSLFMAMNSRLPEVVKANMSSPALNNRTGRFAESVRIVDVSVTAQGYPSVGYTYLKNPYQTFESGYKQGSADIDPRKLIDRSIREIAAQYAIGRFYTRRV